MERQALSRACHGMIGNVELLVQSQEIKMEYKECNYVGTNHMPLLRAHVA